MQGSRTHRLGELFCGPGGLAWGALSASIEINGEKHAIRHAWANDFDRDSCETYNRNIKPDRVIRRDVRKLDFSQMSEIDALAFGFPCNDFSVVGEKKGMNGVYGPLYSYGIKALRRFKPKWFLAENVGGLRSANDGCAFQVILEEMQDAGYKITPHLYRFEEYGVPQARHRIIIIGIRSDVSCEFRVPAPSTPYPETYRTSSDAIENPPIPDDAQNNELTNQSETVVERLKHIKPGENAFNADLPDHLKINVKGARISQIYRRLDPDKPSYTVTGSGGGGTHVYHWSEDRALTNRERARLQTFPDNFVFSGSKASVRRQIGMAIPPQGAKAVIKAVLKTFAGAQYESIGANMLINGQTIKRVPKQDRLLERRRAYRQPVR